MSSFTSHELRKGYPDTYQEVVGRLCVCAFVGGIGCDLCVRVSRVSLDAHGTIHRRTSHTDYSLPHIQLGGGALLERLHARPGSLSDAPRKPFGWRRSGRRLIEAGESVTAC